MAPLSRILGVKTYYLVDVEYPDLDRVVKVRFTDLETMDRWLKTMGKQLVAKEDCVLAHDPAPRKKLKLAPL